MEQCKVYKGLNQPCKIKGVYKNYFYIMFTSVIVGGMSIGLNLNSLIKDGSFSFFSKVFFIVITLIAFYAYFYNKSNKPKRKLDRNIHTISNRTLYKTLNMKNNG